MSIEQAAEEEKLKLQNAVGEVKMQIVELELQIQETTKLFRISKEKITATRNNVRTTVEEMIRVLKEHENLMMTELDIIEKRQEKDHSILHEHLQMSVKELKSAVQNCEMTMERKIDVEALQTQMNEIEKSRRVLKANQNDFYKPSHVGYLRDEKYIQDFSGATPGVILVSKTDPSSSLVSGQNLKKAEAGRIMEFDIATTDSFGKQCYLEIDDIKVKVCSPVRKEIDIKVDDWHSRGKYSVTFTPDCDGQYEVSVLVNDQPLPCSPWNVSVRPHKYTSSFNFASLRKGRKFKEP